MAHGENEFDPPRPRQIDFLARLAKDSKLFRIQEVFFYKQMLEYFSTKLKRIDLMESKNDFTSIIGPYEFIFMEINNAF